jgi:predicted nuclease of predicted toxin-antitoxin system
VKLLFDQNLSRKLVARLADIFPDSTQTGMETLASANDAKVWDFAKKSGFTIVTLDSDFAELSVLRGPPPKIIWLRCGNSAVDGIERLLRANADGIRDFLADESSGCLEVV